MSESQKERWKVTEGSGGQGVEVSLCSSGPKPQEKGSVPDWAIVLITLTLVAATVSLLYSIKKMSGDIPGSPVVKTSPSGGFPGGAVVESLPADAGDAGSSPGLGRSHMPRSGWAREPQLLSLRVWSLCPAAGGAAIERGPRTAMKSGPRTAMKSGPRLPQLEKALARTEDPTQPKINK